MAVGRVRCDGGHMRLLPGDVLLVLFRLLNNAFIVVFS